MALTGKSLRRQLPCNLQLPVRRYLVWGIECPRPLNRFDAKDLGSPFCYEYSTGARLQKAQLQKLKEAWNSCEVSVNNAFNTTRPRPDKLPMPHRHRSGSLIPFPVLTSNQLICSFVGVLFLKNNGVFLSALDRLSTTNLSWNPNARMLSKIPTIILEKHDLTCLKGGTHTITLWNCQPPSEARWGQGWSQILQKSRRTLRPCQADYPMSLGNYVNY